MAKFACRCGAVQGTVAEASPQAVNRVICYCDDCQAFAHHLGRPDLLDEHGGTDIIQVAPAMISFDAGREYIAGIRLSPNGLHRWYARCCNTPMGNTVGPSIPLVGTVAQVFHTNGQVADRLFGRPAGAIMAQYAIGAPEGASRRIGSRLMLSSIAKVIGWRLKGKAWPNPFFDRATKRPHYRVTVVPETERQRLRAFCGPTPRSFPRT
ncbi:MAG: hypothetical protein JNM89_02695 [Hyphomicrobiaceae bacterium]|nr:hypothetical protein [Hyphomicrobiaceae bacterium]